MHLPKTLCFRFLMMKSCMAKNLSWIKCPGTNGSGLQICGPCMDTCGVILERKCYSWAARSVNGGNGTMMTACNGICLSTIGIGVFNVTSLISIDYMSHNLHSIRLTMIG